jgi:hypothetical protein
LETNTLNDEIVFVKKRNDKTPKMSDENGRTTMQARSRTRIKARATNNGKDVCFLEHYCKPIPSTAVEDPKSAGYMAGKGTGDGFGVWHQHATEETRKINTMDRIGIRMTSRRLSGQCGGGTRTSRKG